VARFDEHGAAPGRRRPGDGDERLLVVDVEGAESEALFPGPGVQGASRFRVRHPPGASRSTIATNGHPINCGSPAPRAADMVYTRATFPARRITAPIELMEETMGARTGEQFLKGLRGTKRQLWVDGERIDDVTAHPALAGAAQTLAGVFDRLH